MPTSDERLSDLTLARLEQQANRGGPLALAANGADTLAMIGEIRRRAAGLSAKEVEALRCSADRLRDIIARTRRRRVGQPGAAAWNADLDAMAVTITVLDRLIGERP